MIGISDLYVASDIKQSMMLDFKNSVSSVASTEERTPTGNKIYSFQYKKDGPNIIVFKCDLKEDYRSLNISQDGR